ncbi:MAG: hypothetical protein IPO27_03445 [Bacteroidetes bacterium]|nr:hypothetical protein [Bacteroidota bacterium]
MSKKTASQIIKSKNDYVLKIKKNQSKLLEQAQHIRRHHKAQSTFSKSEKNRGRKETRIIKTYLVNDDIKGSWEGAKMIIYVLQDEGNEREKCPLTNHCIWAA